MVDIARINFLAKKSREVGLTEEEKQEQAILRREYIDSVKASFTSQMGPKEEWIQLRKEQEAKKKGK